MHFDFMIAISILFVLMFAVMLRTMVQHHRAQMNADQASGQAMSQANKRFGGPQGRSQWIWAVVPLLILGAVNFELIRGAIEEESGGEQFFAQAAKLAKVQPAPVEKERAARGRLNPDDFISIILSFAPEQLPQPRLQ